MTDPQPIEWDETCEECGQLYTVMANEPGGRLCVRCTNPDNFVVGKRHARETQEHWLVVAGCEALAKATCAIRHKDEDALQMFKDCLSKVVRGQLDLGEAQKQYAEKCK